jgi:hypothetical protein
MYLLRQSTTGQEVPLGYFLDSSDGDTEETGLTIANTDIKLHKTGATTLADKNTGGGTHISNGVYYATFDATDTDTLGPMAVFVHVSGALAVRLECLVVTSARYDVMTGATANTPSDLVQISGDSTAADNAEAFFDGTGYAGTNNVIPTVTNLTNAPANGDLTATMKASVTSAVPTATAIGTQVWATAGRALSDPAGFKKNTQANITFVMRDSTNGRTPIAGETVTAQRSLDGAAFASCANSVTEIGNGAYIITLADNDLNADLIILRFTSSGSDDLLITIKTET